MDAQAELDQRKRPTTVEDLADLRRQLDDHLGTIERAAEHREFVQVDLGRRLVEAFRAVLADDDGLDDDGRATVRAAVDYFVQTNDAEDDLFSPIGLEDDAFIANAAFEAVGRADLNVSAI